MFALYGARKTAAFFIILALMAPACQDHHYIAYDKVKEHPKIEKLPPAQRGRLPGSQSGFSGTIIAGTVKLDPSVGELPKQATLFVIARSSKGVVAVGADPAAKFPYTFLLNEVNVMMDNLNPKVKLTLDVRLDGDGDAMTKDPSDLYGSVKGELDFGAEGLVVILKRGSAG